MDHAEVYSLPWREVINGILMNIRKLLLMAGHFIIRVKCSIIQKIVRVLYDTHVQHHFLWTLLETRIKRFFFFHEMSVLSKRLWTRTHCEKVVTQHTAFFIWFKINFKVFTMCEVKRLLGRHRCRWDVKAWTGLIRLRREPMADYWKNGNDFSVFERKWGVY